MKNFAMRAAVTRPLTLAEKEILTIRDRSLFMMGVATKRKG
jgi:hypothetical protein